MTECKKCNSKLITLTSYVSDWVDDDDPYEGITEGVNITAQYCKECEAFDGIYFESPMIEVAK